MWRAWRGLCSKFVPLGLPLDRARAAAMARDADPAPAQKRRARAVTSRAALRGWGAAAGTNFEQSHAEGRSRADLDAIMSGYVGRVRPLAVP